MRNFINKLQKSDEATKKKWLIILSALSIVVVIALWLAYLNLIIPKMPPIETITEEVQQKPGFFETFKIGLNSIISQIKTRTKNAFNYFKKEVETERNIIIEKKAQNFILEETATTTTTTSD